MHEVRIHSHENPARRIWRELGFDATPDFNQALSSETLAEAERRMASSGEYSYSTNYVPYAQIREISLGTEANARREFASNSDNCYVETLLRGEKRKLGNFGCWSENW